MKPKTLLDYGANGNVPFSFDPEENVTLFERTIGRQSGRRSCKWDAYIVNNDEVESHVE